jgi:hypothetical protein
VVLLSCCDISVYWLGYELDIRGIFVLFLARTGDYSLLERIGVSCGVIPASCLVHTRGIFWGVKWPGHESDHLMCLVPTVRMNGAIFSSSHFSSWCVGGWLYSTVFSEVIEQRMWMCQKWYALWTLLSFCNILMNISLAEMLNTERKHEKIKLNWN